MAQKPNTNKQSGDKAQPIVHAPKPSQASKSGAGQQSPKGPQQIPVPPAKQPLPPPPSPHPQPDDPSNWMAAPQGVPNCPPGLEYLSLLDQLLIEQKIDLADVLFEFKSNYEFYIRNAMGQHIYHAIEDNDCCTRNCLKSGRPFHMSVFDNYRQEVIHFYRPCRCQSCCCFCCLQELEVTASGELCGRIEQEWTLWYSNFRIKNHLGETVLLIKGPFCTSSCFNDVNFKVVSLNGTEVGLISKHWSGLLREAFTNADFFGISFPVDLDVRMKAVMLGAVMLINSMHYEADQSRQQQQRSGENTGGYVNVQLCLQCCCPRG